MSTMAINPSSPRTLAAHLDWATCDRARLARDRTFDGVFFSGVRSTRIYCRPVCPVRPARSQNVTPDGRRRRTCGISSLPALSSGSGSGFPGLGGHGDDGGAGDAHDR
jgi:hypothetical protein